LATTTTATTNFSSTVTALVQRRVLENLRARYVHVLDGSFTRGDFIKGTNLISYATYADLAAVTAALTEGSPPTDQALAISVESFSATQLGGTIAISDLAAQESPHRLIAIGADRAGDQAARSMDTFVRDIIAAGTSVFYAGTATSRATVAASHVMTGALVKRMVTELENLNVPRFGDGYYRAIIHPRQKYDLLVDTATGGWIDSFKYTNEMGGPLSQWEAGSYGGVRFFVSSAAKVFATAGASSANVYAALFFGPDSYTLGDIQSLNSYFVPPGGDHNDPLAQKAILGWKVTFGAKLLTGPGQKLLRLETGATNG
jgi:N4-gp56 family major capsid protein